MPGLARLLSRVSGLAPLTFFVKRECKPAINIRILGSLPTGRTRKVCLSRTPLVIAEPKCDAG
jgi:hypothetical protein